MQHRKLEGRAIDATDAKPIAGATVTIATDPRRVAISARDGSFAFDGLVPRRYHVRAWKDDRYADAVSVRVSAASEPLIMRMKTGTTLRFVITAQGSGAPIAGAHLRVDGERSIDTDATGTAEVRGLGTGFHHVEIAADGWAPAAISMRLDTQAGGVRELPVVLSHGAALAGVVVDPAGKPVAKARVSIERREPDRFGASADTGADGSWRFACVAPGAYHVSAAAWGFPPSASTTVVLDGAHDVTGVVLALRRGTEVSAIVVDEGGAPVGDAQVVLVVHGIGTMELSADPRGRFVYRGLPPRPAWLFARSGTKASSVMQLDGARGAADVRLTLVDAMIAGTVVDTSGTPIARASVRAKSADDGIPGRDFGLADSSGRFELGPLPAGAYRVFAEWPGTEADNHNLRAVEVTATSGQRDVRVVLAAPGAITGVVLVAGRPARHVAVGLQQGSYDIFHNALIVNSDDGSFARPAVPAGTWSVAIAGEDFELHIARDVTVEPNKTTDLGTIELPLAPRVHGRVVDSAGRPVAGARVAMGLHVLHDGRRGPLRDALAGGRVAISDEDGRFELARAATFSPRTTRRWGVRPRRSWSSIRRRRSSRPERSAASCAT